MLDCREDLVAVGIIVAMLILFIGLGFVPSSEVVLYLWSSSDT